MREREKKNNLPAFQVQGLVNQSPNTSFLGATVSQVSASYQKREKHMTSQMAWHYIIDSLKHFHENILVELVALYF